MASATAIPSGVAVLALIALAVLITLMVVNRGQGAVAPAASVTAANGADEARGVAAATADGDNGESGRAPVTSATWPTGQAGVPFHWSPASPYGGAGWVPVPVWGRDLYNRDPVCYGDPACRDAYFRDWPWARRPSRGDRKPSRPAPQPSPITITVTSPSTSTSTATNSVVSSGSAPTSAATSTSSSEEIMAERSTAPVVVVQDELAEPAPVGGSEDAASSAADEGSVAAGARAGGCRSCTLGATRPALHYDDVFPPTMDRAAYSL
jgi:hypothetical protein